MLICMVTVTDYAGGKKKKKVTHYMTIKERDDASDLHFLCIISKFLMIDLLLILEVGCT